MRHKNTLPAVFAKLVLALAFTFGSAQANVLVTTPNAYTNSDANGAQSGAFVNTGRTFQYVYDASQFAGLNGLAITSMAFRANVNQSGSYPALPMTFTNYDIQLSDSMFSPGNLSTTFANNIGANAVTVRSGAFTVPAGSFTAGGNPNAFGFVIPFSTPYLYDGNDLLITLRHTGQGDANANFFLDAIFNNLSAVSEGIGATSYSATSIPGKLSGQSAITSAPIIQFSFVPGPSGLPLLLVGVAGMVMSKRINRAKLLA
ncbi:MAG: hypothetical protein NTV43_15740 [Methylococcales bacterium]|nr:hypothetical protein [Methylococcales bacterium]